MPHFLQKILVKMVVSILALVATAERCLGSKSISDAELLPHDDSHGRLLRLLDGEGAILIVE